MHLKADFNSHFIDEVLICQHLNSRSACWLMALGEPLDCYSRRKCFLGFLFFLIISCSGKHTKLRIFILHLSSEGKWKNKIIKIRGLQWYWKLTHLCTPHVLCHVPADLPCNHLPPFQSNVWKTEADSRCIYSNVNPEPLFQIQQIYLCLPSSKHHPHSPILRFQTRLVSFENNFSKLQPLALGKLNLLHLRRFSVMSGRWLQNFDIDVTILVKVLT